jgi:hypothetical protein
MNNPNTPHANNNANAKGTAIAVPSVARALRVPMKIANASASISKVFSQMYNELLLGLIS